MNRALGQSGDVAAASAVAETQKAQAFDALEAYESMKRRNALSAAGSALVIALPHTPTHTHMHMGEPLTHVCVISDARLAQGCTLHVG